MWSHWQHPTDSFHRTAWKSPQSLNIALGLLLSLVQGHNTANLTSYKWCFSSFSLLLNLIVLICFLFPPGLNSWTCWGTETALEKSTRGRLALGTHVISYWLFMFSFSIFPVITYYSPRSIKSVLLSQLNMNWFEMRLETEVILKEG